MFPFLFNWSQSKGGVIYKMSNLVFVKVQPSSDKRTKCWNVQTAEKANLCALINIIYIKFQSYCFSVSSLGGVPKVHAN